MKLVIEWLIVVAKNQRRALVFLPSQNNELVCTTTIEIHDN